MPVTDQLDLLRQWDRHIHAFATLPEVPVGHVLGPLAGVRVGVKDIIDVAGLPTKCGSVTRKDAPPAKQDAPVVAGLRAAGAVILGKTTTTEFAFTDPTPCRNPHDLRWSPGGSSSGSGAAVAAGCVDIALGTQTAGSLCRPAAYCGVVGFKPTAGVLPQAGVVPLAPRFDCVGIIARDVALAQAGFQAMAPAVPSYDRSGSVTAVQGLWADDALVDADWQAALVEASAAFDGAVAPGALPADVASVVAAHRCVMCAEAAAAYGAMLSDARGDMLGRKFKAGLQAGLRVSPADLRQARAFLAQAKRDFWRRLSDVDLVLTLPVPEGAPLLCETTGFQDWLTPWTVFGGPLLCLPWGVDRLMRPRSVMLATHPGRDEWLLQVGAQLAEKAPGILPPNLPN